MFCNVCNKLCSTVANLRMHMKTHQSWKFSSSAINVPLHGCGIVSSRCSSDNMPFFRRSLIFWKRLVPGYQLSPFCNPTTLSMWPMWKGEALLPLAKVTLCYKVFTTPGSLRNHTKIHTGATSCPVCSRQLATVSSLNRHMKSEHREALDAIWADRSIKVLFQNHIVSLVPSPPKTLWMNGSQHCINILKYLKISQIFDKIWSNYVCKCTWRSQPQPGKGRLSYYIPSLGCCWSSKIEINFFFTFLHLYISHFYIFTYLHFHMFTFYILITFPHFRGEWIIRYSNIFK